MNTFKKTLRILNSEIKYPKSELFNMIKFNTNSKGKSS